LFKSQIEAEAKGRDITDATLRRARLALKISFWKVAQPDGHGPWMWALPEPVAPDAIAVALEFQEAPATVSDDP
jgi:hypothetical protein